MAALEKAVYAAPGGVLALQGMRGMGKTTLARALCASMQHSFPGCTCLIELPTLDMEPSDLQKEQLVKEATGQAARQLGQVPNVRPFTCTCRLQQPFLLI